MRTNVSGATALLFQQGFRLRQRLTDDFRNDATRSLCGRKERGRRKGSLLSIDCPLAYRRRCVSVDVNANAAVANGVSAGGAVVISVSGGVASTVHALVAGDGSTCPARSTARTANV